MSVEVKGSGISINSSPAKSFGGIKSHSAEGSLGASYKPMFSISKEGNMTTLGGTMNKVKNTEIKAKPTSSYRPLFSIDKVGNTKQIGSLDFKKPDHTPRIQQVMPLKVDASPFSKDTVVPKAERIPSKQTVFLYKAPEKAAPMIERVKPIEPPKTRESLPIRSVTAESVSRAERLDATRQELKLIQQTSLPKPEITPSKKPADLLQPTGQLVDKSSWEKRQSDLLTKREQIQNKPDLPKPLRMTAPEPTPSPFMKVLSNRTEKVNPAQKVVTNPTILEPMKIAALEKTVKMQSASLPQPTMQTLTEVAPKLKKETELKLGKVILSPNNETSHDQTITHAQAEVTTMLKDGSAVVQKMTQILISQGVEPKIAQEKALEQTTQTLVKAITAKGLAVALNEMTDTEATTKTETKTKQVTSTQTEQKTDEKDEEVAMIPVRDHQTDALRVMVLTDVGSELLHQAQSAGQSSVDLAAIAGEMPEAPGVLLASVIRMQLRLHLESEEQYDSFINEVSKMGTVSSESEITKAAMSATDQAPAVILAKDGEPVMPKDVDSALKDGNPIKKMIKVIKETIIQTIHTALNDTSARIAA